MTTLTVILPALVTLILIVSRVANKALERLITRATVVLMVSWVALALVAAAAQHPTFKGAPVVDDLVLVVGYIAIASLALNALTVLLYIAQRLTNQDESTPTPLHTRVARIASVVCIAVVIYIVSTHKI
jgi:hypothetical protein